MDDRLAQLTALVVCEWFDGRGFGLAAAARCFSNHLPDDIAWEAVVSVPPSGSEGLLRPLHHRAGGKGGRLLKVPAALLPLVRSRRPAVVHLHGIWTGAVGLIPALRREGARVVVSLHGMCEPFILGRRRWRKSLLDLLFHHRCLRQADAIHCLNQHEREMAGRYLGPGGPDLVVLPNGVEAPTAAPLPAGPVVFLFCGRIAEQKRLDLLLDAWARAGLGDEAELRIAGAGDDAYARRILARAAALPGVRLLGRVDGDAKSAAFAASHIGVLSSQAEGQSISLLESLASGRPVVATPECHMPELGRAGLGWIAGDIVAYAEALRSAVRVPVADLEAMSRRCRTFAADHHDWRVQGRLLGALYRDLMQVGAATDAGG